MQSAPALSRPTTLARPVTAELVLAGLVLASIVVRLVAVLGRATPRYLPDEHLYAGLARSFGLGDGMAVLGSPSSFPSPLQPLLSAPLWRLDGAEAAFRLTQLLHVSAMSAAAIPVYLLARQLDLAPRWSLVCAAVTLVSPSLLYSGYVTADALGYLLALVAVLVAVRALARRTVGGELLLVASVGLAASARIQYVALLPVCVLAAVVLERGRINRVARSLPVLSLLALVVPLAGLAAGAGGLGRYQATTTFAPSSAMLGWTASTVFLLVLAAGVAVVPGALAWIASCAVRPTSPERSAFAALAALLTAALVVAVVVMTVETGSNRFLERYLVILTPLAGVAFACWVADGRPLRYVARATALLVAVVVSLVPLSTYAEGQGRSDSPLLLGVSSLADRAGVGNASLAAAGVATLAALVAAVAATSWRHGSAAAASAALAVLALVSVGAHVADISVSRALRAETFAGDADWVDAERAGSVLLVQTPWSGRAEAMLTSFWNTSVRRAAALGEDGIEAFDGLSTRPLTLRRDGTIIEGGRPVTAPVLLATGGTRPVFTGGARVVADRFFALVVPDGAVRLAALVEGLRYDGMLAPTGRLTAYPLPDRRCSTLRLRVTLPSGFPTTTIELSNTGGATERVRLRSGSPTTLSVTSRPTAGASLRYRVVGLGGDGRMTPGRIAQARLLQSARACERR